MVGVTHVRMVYDMNMVGNLLTNSASTLCATTLQVPCVRLVMSIQA